MIRDRLPELKALCGNKFDSRELFKRTKKYQNEELNRVLNKIEHIRNLIDSIAQNVKIVQNFQDDILILANKEIQRGLENKIYTTSQTACSVKNELQKMSNDIVVMDISELNFQKMPVHVRIGFLQYKMLTIMYRNIMMEYNESLMRYHNNCKSILLQEGALIRRKITNEELNEMLGANETSLFVDDILYNTKMTKVQLFELEDRHAKLEKLEKTILEMRDLFTDMAFLIEAQGDAVDSIYQMVSNVANSVESGQTKLKVAKKKKRQIRKKELKIMAIVGTISSILVALAFI